MFGVEVTALLGAELKLTFLLQCKMIKNQQIITITNSLCVYDKLFGVIFMGGEYLSKFTLV